MTKFYRYRQQFLEEFWCINWLTAESTCLHFNLPAHWWYVNPFMPKTSLTILVISSEPEPVLENIWWKNVGQNLPYIWLFWLCEILALLGQNGGKEIMAHINFDSPRVWAKITSLLKLSYYLKWQNVCRCIACILVQSVKSNSVQK